MTRVMAPVSPLRPTIRLSALGAAAVIACLGGCSVARTAFGPLQYDKKSAAAEAIATTDVSKQAYPSLLQVQPQPDDLRPISAWNRDIFATQAARRHMEAFQVAQPQTLYGSEAFAQDSRALATPPPEPDQVPAGSSKAPASAGPARATPPSPAP